ncbi:hypothetical protein [Sphingomonas sp. GB1N7]|uniref:hypothetical protein n=1 Tax=Parasphingomonas caseinilytica TaxID=3096158 RepID=UPI002FC724E4
MTPTTSPEALVVTIGVNAQCIGDKDAQRKVFVPPAAKYTNLPYRDAGHELHNSGPYTDRCVSEYGALDPATVPLVVRARGVHLHWMLPEALTRGRVSGTGGVPTAVMASMPSVPNRWLIVRSGTTAANGPLPQASWVVESDRVATEPGAHACALVPSLPAKPAHPTAEDQLPYAYLGHAQSTPWHEGGDQTARYLGDRGSRLTAIVGGSVHFASLYSECAGVFGFHDPITDDNALLAGTTLSYDIIGWYGGQQTDILHSLPERLEQTGWREQVVRELGWTLPDEMHDRADAQVRPVDSVYHGRLTGISWDPGKSYLGGDPGDLDLKKVAIGNSPGEATAALLAHLANNAPPAVEDLINALMLGKLPEIDRAADIEAAIAGTLKRARFRSMPGGSISCLKQRPASDGEPATPLNDDIAAQLSQVVRLERTTNALARRIDTMRWQVFVDWGKFLELNYGGAPDAAAATNVGNYLFRSLTDPAAPLPSALADIQTARTVHLPLLRERLAHSVSGTSWDVIAVPDAPFWQPNPPTVLLFGDGALPGELHAERRAVCTLASAIIAEAGPAPTGETPILLGCRHHSLIAALLASCGDGREASWRPDWNPFMLGWSVQFAPVQWLSSEFASINSYASDFLTERYAAPVEGELHFAGATGPGEYQDYHGHAFMTPRPRQTIADALALYVLDHPDDPVDPAVQEIIGALQDIPILTQSLSGFDDALRMRRSGSQLPVLDPVGDAMTRALVERVAAHVVGMTSTSPWVTGTFNPIRAGFVVPTSLRLIDTFGHCRVITDFTDKLVFARSMVAPSGADPSLAELCPRFAQPSRLSGRWLPARDDDWIVSAAPGSTPVFGWVLFNHVDRALAIYDAAGNGIGSFILGGADDTVAWQAFPGSGKSDDPVVAFADQDPRLADLAINGLWHWPSASAPTPAVMLKPLLAALGRATDIILPESFLQTRGNALLVGRPLALARLAIKLDLYGEPACGEEAAYFARSRFDPDQPPPRWTAGFAQVAVPTQLGGTGTADDGVVGYFAERAGKPSYDLFFSSFADGLDGPVASPGAFPLEICADPAALAHSFTVLVDPRAPAPVESALHPADALALDPAHFADAVEAIRVAFFTAPVLTDPDQLAMPLPAQGAGKWRWVYRDAHGWQSTNAIGRPGETAMPSAHKRTLREGWLVLDPGFHEDDGGLR